MSACPERCLIMPYRRRYFPRYNHYQRDSEGVWDIEVLRAWLTVIKWQLKARNPVCLSWDMFFLFWSLPHSWFEQPNGFSQQSSSASFSEMLLSLVCDPGDTRTTRIRCCHSHSTSKPSGIYREVLKTLKHSDSRPLVSLWSWFIDALIFWLCIWWFLYQKWWPFVRYADWIGRKGSQKNLG